MRDNIGYRLVSVIIFAIVAAGAAGLSHAALTDREMNLKYPASGYFLNPCTEEIVAYNGYVHLREADHRNRMGYAHGTVRENSQELKGFGTTTGDTYMIRIGPGRSVGNPNGENKEGEHAFKVEGMNVIHLGRGVADDWIVDDVTILTVNDANGFPTVAKFIIKDGSCD